MNTRYFQWSLLLPIVVPLLLWALNAAVGSQVLNAYLPNAVMVAGAIVWASLWFGGLPYVGCAVWAYRKINNVTPAQAIAFWWRFPLVFLAVEFVFLVLAVPVLQYVESGSWNSAMVGIPQAIMVSLFVIPVGYFYASVVVGVYRIAQRLRQSRSARRSRWCLGCE